LARRSSPPGPNGSHAVTTALDERPILVTVISTEEEFDWHEPFDPRARSVQAMRSIDRAQEIFDAYGVRPAYVVTHPVASDPDGWRLLKEYHDSGRCEIGAHLHPWVSPPISEDISIENSYPGNLPPELEAEKLRVLVDTIAQTFGRRPITYQAGRYGFGAHTFAALRAAGIEIDISATPPFDFGPEGGPDYSRLSAKPRWVGEQRDLLVMPVTGAYVGYLQWSPHSIYRMASAMSWARLPGILSRLGAIDRLRLSPEGFTPEDNARLVRFLLARGLRVFVYSFHSPSVVPGCTPYVRTQRDLEVFLDRCRRFYEFFFGELGGVSMTPAEFKRHLELGSRAID
jgi:hypothetical protein